MWSINNTLAQPFKLNLILAPVLKIVYCFFSYGVFFFWCSEIVFLKYSYSQSTFDEHVLISGFSVATGKMSQPNFFVLGAPGFSNKNGNIGAVSPKIKIDPALTFVKMCPRYKKNTKYKKRSKNHLHNLLSFKV